MVCLASMLLCTNHPDSPGALREVMPMETCRHFQPKRCRLPQDPPRAAAPPESDEEVRRIPLTQGLFALVDAADYERLIQYKWCAVRRGKNVYAYACVNGKQVSMHRYIMKAPKGWVVDHIRHNGVDNRRSNLRLCTEEQNHANRGPRGGSSRFVGVYRRGKKWAAEISWRAENYYLGTFDDEIEAAQARDRKARELHGKHAYLNFPEDFAH